jgi:hypothetical protein
LISSRSFSIWSRSLWPIASRMPVSAAWTTAPCQDSTDVTTSTGSAARNQSTAFTRTATPSRVIVSWVSSW